MGRWVKLFSSENVGALEESVNAFIEKHTGAVFNVQYQAFVTSRNVERYTAMVFYACQ